MAIELGRSVRDKITGFEGIVTGFVQYLTGCNQALVVPKCEKSHDMPSGNWIDEQRLEYTSTEAIKLDNSKTPGFDMEPPKR